MIFMIIFPFIKNSFVEKENSSIRQLVESKIQILDSLNTLVEEQLISLSKAQETALKIIREQRYGENREFYFWITDKRPVLLMHPFREDLVNKDVGTYRDPEGKFLFTEMVEITEVYGEGYLEYFWELPYMTDTVIEKKSYVKLYEPWGWIIGTGFYIDQLSLEINSLFLLITILSFFVLVLVVIISVYILRQRLVLSRQNQYFRKNFKDSEERYKNLIDRMNEGFVLLDADRRVMLVNQKFCEMVGTAHEDIIGRFVTDYICNDERDLFASNINQRKVGVNDSYEIDLIGKGNSRISTIVSPMGLFGEKSEFQGSFAVYTDISSLKAVQNQLESSLTEKEVLIKEIHHRVKNNLQIIMSLLNFQKMESKSAELNEILIDFESRVYSMALVHELLYESPVLESVNIKHYTIQLVENLIFLFRINSNNISLLLAEQKIISPIDKVTLIGLIITEMFVKFSSQSDSDSDSEMRNYFKIESAVIKDDYILKFSIYKMISPALEKDDVYLGLNLIKELSFQLGGTFKIGGLQDDHGDGHVYSLTVPLKELRSNNNAYEKK